MVRGLGRHLSGIWSRFWSQPGRARSRRRVKGWLASGLLGAAAGASTWSLFFAGLSGAPSGRQIWLSGLGSVLVTVLTTLTTWTSVYQTRERENREPAARAMPPGRPGEHRARYGDDEYLDLLVEQIRTEYLRDWLDRFLHIVARIELRLSARDDLVIQRRTVLRRRLHVTKFEDVTNIEVGALFHSVGDSLLIVGEPGSGKTTLLLDLTRTLLNEAGNNPDRPVPVVCNLSSWRSGYGTLDRWVAEVLVSEFGIPRITAARWLADRRLALLLDGLDEVPARHRDNCIKAINSYHEADRVVSLAVCSRTVEYEELGNRLRLRSAVQIKPLSRAQVEKYLLAAGERLSGVRALLQTDHLLWELMRTPLFLSVVALTYRDREAIEMKAADGVEQLRRQVMDAYFRRMAQEYGPP
jgi:energy-coupling factor transporter ATP-binding protein EcfA2